MNGPAKAMNTACPICGASEHETLYPDYSGTCITSQLFFVDAIVLDNRCCSRCGFIYNARGVRGIEEEIYNTTVWRPKPQIMSFAKSASGKTLTSHQRALETFLSLVDLPGEGTLLDFGAGTGAFLSCFQERFPRWELSAIEPGGGYEALCEAVRLREGFNAPYYQAPVERSYDVILVTSVLEHVNDPLDALRWIRPRLNPGGLLLMQHPNFASLPGDLLCADHINKLTVPYMRALCRHAGFDVVAQDDSQLMFYFALSATDGEPAPIPRCGEENLAIARRCEHIARRTIDCVAEALEAARDAGGKVGVFGTSPVGSMAHLLLQCRDAVACFVDENPNTWDRSLDGIPVVGPDRMKELGVSDLALAISPVYWDQVAEKMSRHPVRVHVPRLDGPTG